MYRIIIGEINKEQSAEWENMNVNTDKILDPVMFEKDCNMGTLALASKTFHNEVQLDWGTFAWKAFKSDIKRFFRKKGIKEKELELFDAFKEYGVMYIDN